jgi:hypothetical protein
MERRGESDYQGDFRRAGAEAVRPTREFLAPVLR